MRRLLLVLFCSFAFAPLLSAETPRSSGNAVIDEMNLARGNPARYADLIAELRAHSDGVAVVLPGGTRIHLREGTRSLDEAIRFLRSATPLPPLSVSAGMSRAAHDHCADQSGGGFGHEGTDGSHACNRMNRYGVWGGGWAENVSYGKANARDVVLALIIDDGQPERKHRKNIFNARYNFAGAAFGSHARFGAMCSIAFAGSYAERGESTAEPLVARNF